MKNIIIFLCLCTICMCRLHAADSSRADSLLLKLDQAIKERPIYMEQKELKLVELKRQLHRQIPDEERFVILGTLLDEYRSFNTDSALHMAEEREQIAIRLGNREYIDNARMNKADVLGMTGMYKEVMDLMRNIRHMDIWMRMVNTQDLTWNWHRLCVTWKAGSWRKNPINWDSKDMELNSGSIDCIWNGFTINGREDDYTWSDPYLNNEQVMVVAADSGIEKLDDLAGKNVVVQAASAALDALNSDDNKDLTASFASLTENPDYNTAFMNLDSGAADAIAVDIGVAKYQLSQREEGKYVILDEPIQSEEYGIGFKKGNDELKDTVWEEVLKLYDAGEVDKLAEKYEVADMLCIGDDEKSDDKKMMQQRMMLPMQTQQKKIQLIQRKMLNSQPEQKQL